MLRRLTTLRPRPQFCSHRQAHNSRLKTRSRPSVSASQAKKLLLQSLTGRSMLPTDLLKTLVDKMPDTRALDFHDGPMVWIDLEMTGLQPGKDKILEVAVLITNGNLEVVDEGIEFIVKAEKSLLDGMDEWCTNQHGKTGLTKACLESPHTTQAVADSVLEYIKKWIPEPRTAVLAGSSVHVDKTFLAVEMPDIVEHLHYRIVDVSTIKELVRRWYPAEKQSPKPAEVSHRALDDIRGSIRELKWYRQNVFVPVPPPGNA